MICAIVLSLSSYKAGWKAFQFWLYSHLDSGNYFSNVEVTPWADLRHFIDCRECKQHHRCKTCPSIKLYKEYHDPKYAMRVAMFMLGTIAAAIVIFPVYFCVFLGFWIFYSKYVIGFSIGIFGVVLYFYSALVTSFSNSISLIVLFILLVNLVMNLSEEVNQFVE
jgi:hypothetical protein